MNEINVVECCFPSIPQVYSNALSYQEALCELQKAINNVIDTLNTYTPVTEQYVADYVANALSGVNDEITQFEKNVNDKLSSYQAEYKNFENTINEQYSEFTSSILQTVNNILTQVDEKNTIFYGYIVTWFNSQIEQIINKLGDGTIITNPVTLKPTPLNATLTQMYTATRYNSLSAYYYDRLGLTCSQYDGKSIRALVYDSAAIEQFSSRVRGVYSAFSGLFISVQNAIYEIYQHLQTNGKTAQEYDALDLTATAYASKNLSAYNYSWNFQ